MAKADAVLREKDAEIVRLGAEHQALREELTAVKQRLGASTDRVEKLHEDTQVGLSYTIFCCEN